jgi:succinate dehydrogenase/fumarate reductase flavoprotein subunit
MKIETLTITRSSGEEQTISVVRIHTLIIGSGAAGLAASVQLVKRGVDDLLVISEGLDKGTSINTGSDKQTYYKLSLCGEDADCPRELAETYFAGGCMHGDQALVEASESARAFLHLVDAGVPFPRDPYGQFVGYKTDHDPRRRATSIGPYTSKRMCEALIALGRRMGVKFEEGRTVVELLTTDLPNADAADDAPRKRAIGAIALDESGEPIIYLAENTVFAVGGPGGIYKTSVYPHVHLGAVGLALKEGALAQNLPESQYGLASIGFRWNVSGTYMQVVPRFISTTENGESEPREFLRDYFGDDVGRMCSNVFLKGYQWPFDSRKASAGSSIIDLLVYIETVLKGRRVFLDFRENPEGFRFEDLDSEAFEYLEKSNALLETPIARLLHMNPGAVDLYSDHGIDVTSEPLEIALCAQHNNGGLAADHWQRSINIERLYPIGEVNGSHGVYRPGGSALNAGQVEGLRAAEHIAAKGQGDGIDSLPKTDELAVTLRERIDATLQFVEQCRKGEGRPWQEERNEFQTRMSAFGAAIRPKDGIAKAVEEAWTQVRRIESEGCRCEVDAAWELIEAVQNRQLALAHAVYLEAVCAQLQEGVGSRGSAIVLDADGEQIPGLDESWRILPEDEGYRESIQESFVDAEKGVVVRWIPRRPIPESDLWFETAWAKFREGAIYDE